MSNTKELMPTRITSLIIGPGKTGKTRSIKTWRPYGPVRMFNFDGGIAALAGEDIEYDVYMDSNRYQPTAYTSFLKDWATYREELRSGKRPANTITVLDGFSFLSRWMMNHIQYTNRTIDKPAGYDGYRMIKDKMGDIIMEAKILPAHLVVTANEQTDKDENTGELSVLPATEGSYRENMPTEFDLVVYARVGKDPKNPRLPKWYWQTVPDHKIKSAGSRWECGLLPEEEQDFGVYMKKIAEKFPHLAAARA